MCIAAPCPCGNTFPGGNGSVYGNYPWGGGVNGGPIYGPNGGNGQWGLGTPGGYNGHWGAGGGWGAQGQVNAYANAQFNYAQNAGARARAGGNVRTDMYANQALYQNYTNAARDLGIAGQAGAGGYGYGGVYPSSYYNGGMNLNGMGSLGVNFNIGLGGSAGYGYGW